jgi:rhamnosyl/mannosyltransferase
MNILLAISETPPRHSGVARIAGRLRAGFAAAGHTVDVLSIEDTGRISIGEVRLTGLLPRWLALRRRVAAADVVSVFGPAPTFSDALLLLLRLRRRGRQRVVYTHVFDLDFPWLTPLCVAYNWTHRQLARAADHVVVPTAGYAAGFPRAGRLSVIPWGIDHAVAPPALEKDARFTILFVGQLRPYKGVATLIRAAGQVPDAQVIIAGDGPERAKLERLAARSGASNVTLLGSVSEAELAGLYARAHVVVLPSVSRLEAFGISLVEGMAAGCVPVASSLPGVREVVGDTGYTFPAGDAEALGRILAALRVDGSERLLRSERARERSAEYSWERTVREHLALYERLIEARSAHLSARPAEPVEPRVRSAP